ncbi:MAG: SdpI family protein [Clostridiaceae bacterium]|nr:SdpI family protein [Clostridiaceae bacterium]
MTGKINKTLIISTVLCLLPIILALILYDQLPEQIAVHFDQTGTPDNYLPKVLAVWGLPIALSLINLYTHFRLNNDPKRENASFILKLAAKWAVPLISLIVLPITYFMAIGAEIPIGAISSAVCGVFIVICGNYLPKCKRNYTVGIKLPWTLDSEEVWNKTHHFAGFVWVIGGIIFIANAFFHSAYVTVGLVILLVALPLIYSYLAYKSLHAAEK